MFEYRGGVANISQYAESDASGKAKASVDIELFTTDTMIVGMGAEDSFYTQILSGLDANEMIVNDLSAADYEDEKIIPVHAS